MALYRRKPIYQKIRRRMILIILAVAILPLIFLGENVYYRFARVYEAKIADEIKYRARLQRESVEVFLRERTAILSTLVDTLAFDHLKERVNLAKVFEAVNRRTEGLFDLGVIDHNGNHLAYVGPYPLEGLDYSQQDWFSEVMSKGQYVSDVFMGYRQIPHFVIAVRGRSETARWILRATIDPEIFGRLIRTAQIGKGSDAYIINKDGIYQTEPRFAGRILSKSILDTRDFGQGTTGDRFEAGNKAQYVAGTWLKNDEWLLIISQNLSGAHDGLSTTRKTEIAIIVLGCLAIIAATIFATQLVFRRLDEADRNISELNIQLIQSDKMAALGRMAAGIAHEINNPLAVIGEKAGWMRDLLEEEDLQQTRNLAEFQSSIEKIEAHVERARKITHNMLGFARRMEPHVDDVDVNSVLIQTLELLENHARINNIEIQKTLQPDLPVIASDQSQLQQVFMNLINNAIDAIGSNGVIRVQTRLEGDNIVVHIQDNGPGIAEEHRGKIFDPFFSTKTAGKGTGLGLSVSYNIITKLGGSIRFDNPPGQGTVFYVRLPVILPEKK